MFGRFLKRRFARMSLTYDQAKELARSGDVEERAALAGRDDVKPELLYFLAEDPDPNVRRAIASNARTPHHADLLLAGDEDEDVRGTLAEKIARIAPDLSSQETDKVRAMAYEALEMLTRDQVSRVRRILAEALKDVAHAPPEVIRRLACDAEIMVSAPVLRYSPVLTDEDLLAILAERPATKRLEAIAGRDEVSEDVVDALVECDDEIAIAVLLDNASAHIREQALERLVARAPGRASWHGPLVRRPQLSEKVARRLAEFVADEFLVVLSVRDDLSKETLQAVREEVSRRLTEEEEGEDAADRKSAPDKAYERASTLHQDGRLSEDVFLAALGSDDLHFVRAALTVKAGVSPSAVAKAVETRSAKGLLALCWRAGFGPKTAERVQRKLGQLSRNDVIKADGGRFAMTEPEMEWHIEFLIGMGD